MYIYEKHLCMLLDPRIIWIKIGLIPKSGKRNTKTFLFHRKYFTTIMILIVNIYNAIYCELSIILNSAASIPV